MGRQQKLRETLAPKEKVDPRQMEIPTGLGAPLPLREQMIAMIRNEMSQFAQAKGLESFDEFDDFEDDADQPDPLTIYEAALLASENPEVFDAAVADVSKGAPPPSPTAEPGPAAAPAQDASLDATTPE